MKPTTRDISVSGDLGGDKIKMGFAEDATAHLMGVLTDLYSDPEQAIIREYSTNALDAHIEAGQSRPIEVTTPTTFAQDFVVRDYGIGLSVDDIQRIYSQYGASTKRGTNAQTGMLGLGCKSGLTYAPSFTVTSWKDGVRIQVIVSRNADGIGEMEVVDTCATDEPNGVEIRIPTHNRNKIEEKAKAFFRFWNSGTVLLNGEPPAPVAGTRVGRFVISNEFDSDYVVMGNVAYPVPAVGDGYYKRRDIISRSVRGYVAVFAEIGDVNFTPSREELMETRRTKEFLAPLHDEFMKAARNYANAEISKAGSFPEAAIAAEKWRAEFQSTLEYTYKGRKIPNFITRERTGAAVPSFWVYDPDAYNARAKRGRGTVYSRSSISASDMANCFMVTGFTAEKPSLTSGEKAEILFGDSERCVIFTNEAFGDPWAAPIQTATYDDVKAIRLARTSTGGGSTRVRTDPYDILTPNGKTVETSDIPKDKVAYASPTDFMDRQRSDSPLRALYHAMNSIGWTVVLIGKNRWDKFVRDYPHALRIDEALTKIQAEILGDLSDAARWHLMASGADYSIARAMANKGVVVDDAEVQKVIGWAGDKDAKAAADLVRDFAKSIANTGAMTNTSYSWNYLGPKYFSRVDSIITSRGDEDSLFSDYPMCYNCSTDHIDHQRIYINAAYAAKEGK